MVGCLRKPTTLRSRAEAGSAGGAWIAADGQQVVFVDPTRLSAHFNFKWVKRYTFVVGQRERHEITIEHERPILLGGLWPNKYRVFVDGCMTEEHHGY